MLAEAAQSLPSGSRPGSWDPTGGAAAEILTWLDEVAMDRDVSLLLSGTVERAGDGGI